MKFRVYVASRGLHELENIRPGIWQCALTDRVRRSGVRISMDGRERYLENIVIERLWRGLTYECIYLNVWETGSEARDGVVKWIEFYNHKRQ